MAMAKDQKAASHSSLAGVGVSQKVREAIAFLKMRSKSRPVPENFDHIFDFLDSYASTFTRFTGRPFEGVNILEIGFGARPLQLIAYMSMGLNIRGIDLDMPMLRFSPARLFQIWKTNGLERALKTAGRSLLFDRSEKSALRAALRKRGYDLRIQKDRFLIGDAATFDFGEKSIDLIYSQVVFEHIPGESIRKLMEGMEKALARDGIAIITLDVFTGITGGHLVEWYPHTVGHDIPRESEPWEHLRKKRFTANTYLNQLSRSDYRKIFREHFEIIEEQELRPDMGRQWLSDEVKADLPQWTEEDLLSNQVQFVLRPLSAGK